MLHWTSGARLGHPLLDGINYWDELKDSPSQREICFAIFVNVLELCDEGVPTNEKYAERRVATWLYKYRTGSRLVRPTWSHGSASSSDRATRICRCECVLRMICPL